MEQNDPMSLNNNLCMKGTIRTKEKCKECSAPFKSIEHPNIKGEVIDIVCETCGRRPKYYYIDGRDMKVGKLYKDLRGIRFDSFLMAHRRLEKMRSQIDDHTFDPNDWIPSKRKEMTFCAQVKKWLKRIKRRVGYSQYRHCETAMNNHFIPELKNYDVRDIRTSHIDDITDKLYDKGLKGKSIKNYLDFLKAFMSYLYSREVIRRMPVFDKIRVEPPLKKWISREQQELVLSYIPVDTEDHLIMETLMETAQRPGYVCAHMKRDLVEDNEIIIDKAFDEAGNLKPEKTNQVIHRAISKELYDKLLKHCEGKQPDDFIFTQPDGRPFNTQKLGEIWREAAGKAGIDISIYPGIRHSRASQKRLEKEKEVAEAVRKELDHKSSKTTMKYYALDRSKKIK